MKLSRAAIALYMGLVFVSGAVVGGFSHRLYTVTTVDAKSTPNPEEFRKRYMAEMKSRVNLTPDQLTKLGFILDETRARQRAAQEASKKMLDPEITAIRLEQIEKIRQMLTPEQRPLYDTLRKEREERGKKAGKTGPGM
jgi:Spy/CpxP family protein refolding chaperone